MDHIVEALTEEVQALRFRIASGLMEADEEDKLLAEQIFQDQQQEICVLRVELKSTKQSRDTYQLENARLKKYIAMLEKQVAR
jgi:transcription initiation factor IIF auxiliary subunit